MAVPGNGAERLGRRGASAPAVPASTGPGADDFRVAAAAAAFDNRLTARLHETATAAAGAGRPAAGAPTAPPQGALAELQEIAARYFTGRVGSIFCGHDRSAGLSAGLTCWIWAPMSPRAWSTI